MKDKLSLMDDTSREEDEAVDLRLEKFRLAAELFDKAGACAAAVRFRLCRATIAFGHKFFKSTAAKADENR